MRSYAARSFVTALFLTATALSSVALASPVVPTNSQVSAEKSKAATLEKNIAAETEQGQIAAEHYDDATVTLQIARQRLVKLRFELRRAARQVKLARRKVRESAIAAYVAGDGAAAQFGAVLSKNIANVATVDTYSAVATNVLQSAVNALQSDESALQKSQTEQAHEVSVASTAVTTAAGAKDSAIASESALQSSLSQVKGQLAQLIAEQEAAAAAAAAARARAAAAANARAQAEADAQAAAGVAQAVAASDPNAATSSAASSATSSSDGSPTPSVQPVGSSTAGNEAVAAAESFLGVPYVFGGATPSGLDCSGLTMLAWAAAGINLYHSAWYQYEDTTRVSLNDLEPGDLLFYDFPNDGTDPVTHVAMYVGSGPYGTSTIIQAPETGEEVSYAALYLNGFVGAGRP